MSSEPFVIIIIIIIVIVVVWRDTSLHYVLP